MEYDDLKVAIAAGDVTVSADYLSVDNSLGNYSEYSGKLKLILSENEGKETLYDKLKAGILSGDITINTTFLPSSSKVFSIVFYHRDIAEMTIRAVVGEDISILDPLVEHRGDIFKAIESCIWLDVLLKAKDDRIFTLDMQRSYVKTRNRNRNIYYGSKELASQKVSHMRYERLNQVSITFIYEKNTTRDAPPISKVQFADVTTKEIYSDLLTLYEVNLNKITDSNNYDLLTLREFLSIKTHEDLCNFVITYDTAFAGRLATEYMYAVVDDALLLKVEGSEKFMIKIPDEVLMEEREEGREEGQRGNLVKLIHRKILKSKTREQIIDELEMDEHDIEVLDNFESYKHFINT